MSRATLARVRPRKGRDILKFRTVRRPPRDWKFPHALFALSANELRHPIMLTIGLNDLVVCNYSHDLCRNGRIGIGLERVGHTPMLSWTVLSWWLAMFQFEVYFDDSGTDGTNEIAIAACYVSSKEQWDEFNRNWKEVLEDEGFDHFHMAEFVAKPEAGHEPFCGWSDERKKRVYRRLAGIMNVRVRHGFAIAVPKKDFDAHAPREFKEQYAENHYVFAVKSLFGRLEVWRGKYHVAVPMQYVFDRGAPGERQIKEIWGKYSQDEEARKRYGLADNGGALFQNKKLFRPLQAADILAWQMHNHMRKVIVPGCQPNQEFSRSHAGFSLLRYRQSLDLGFYSTEQTRDFFAKTKKHHETTGRWPWEHAGPIGAKVSFTEPGKI